MSYRTYRMMRAFLGVIIGGVTGASVTMDNWIIPIPTIIIAIVINVILRRRVKEIVSDERTYAIAEKAARFTLSIGVIGMAVLGAIFLMVSRNEIDAMTQVGFAMEYAACSLLLISSFAYIYYSKKLGGSHE
jgi:uncharacterized membrane protein